MEAGNLARRGRHAIRRPAVQDHPGSRGDPGGAGGALRARALRDAALLTRGVHTNPRTPALWTSRRKSRLGGRTPRARAGPPRLPFLDPAPEARGSPRPKAPPPNFTPPPHSAGTGTPPPPNTERTP